MPSSWHCREILTFGSDPSIILLRSCSGISLAFFLTSRFPLSFAQFACRALHVGSGLFYALWLRHPHCRPALRFLKTVSSRWLSDWDVIHTLRQSVESFHAP